MEFNYQIKTQTGEAIEGKIEAGGEDEAVKVLHGRGYTILSLQQIKKDIFSVDLNQYINKPNNKDIVVFTRQLSTLIDANMPLAEGLRTLAKQIEKVSFKKVVAEISEAVEGGSSLSKALAAHPKLFSLFYIKLVQSGEVSGKLNESLLYVADYLERSKAINSKIIGALAYPAFVIFALIVVTSIMVVYVLPQLLVIFEEIGVEELPITTRALIFLTDFINKFLYAIIIGFLAVAYALWSYIRTPAGQAWLDNAKINFPVLGQVVRNLYLARISESLATLIKAGIPILDVLRVTADLVDNNNYRNIMLAAEDNVRRGGKISEVLAEHHKEVPPLFASMVAIGEKTGKLDFILGHIAKFYKGESDDAISGISQLIEPILILLLGIGVAILISSILLPIYNLVGVG